MKATSSATSFSTASPWAASSESSFTSRPTSPPSPPWWSNRLVLQPSFLEFRQFLLQRQHRRKQVTKFFGASDDRLRLKFQGILVAGSVHFLQFLPPDRGRGGGPFFRAQGIDADGRFMFVVLTPVH